MELGSVAMEGDSPMATDSMRAQLHGRERSDVQMDALREQVERLTALVEQQQTQIVAQQARAERQQDEIAAQRAEIAQLRERQPAPAADSAKMTRTRRERRVARSQSRPSSRRALLKGAGAAAAAAAAVALAAGEGKGALAAPMNNGDAIVAGSTTLASLPTVLQFDGSPGDAKIQFLVNDTEFTAAGSSIGAALAGWVGAGGTSGNNAGIYGYSGIAGGYGVIAYAPAGYGLYAHGADTSGSVYPALYAINTGSGNGATITGADDATGLYASVGGTFGNGVLGTATGGGGYGVWGTSDTGYGVVGSSGSGIDVQVGGEGGQGRLAQRLQASAGAPTSGGYSAGEQIRDHNGDLWLCVASGSPGTWVRASHPVAGYSGGAISYLSKPIRLLDTRGSDPNAQHNGGGPYTAPGSPYNLQIAGVNWMSVLVPGNAVGAIGKLTVISGASGSGFVALVPSGSGSPTTGTLPYGPNQIVATGFNVGLGGSPASLDIYIGGTPVDIVIDLFAVVA